MKKKKETDTQFSLWISLAHMPNHSQRFWNDPTVETYNFALGVFLVKSRHPCSVGLAAAAAQGFFHFSMLHRILCKSHVLTNTCHTHPWAQLLMNNLTEKWFSKPQKPCELQGRLMLGHVLNCSKEHCFLMHFLTVEELCSSEPLPYDKHPVMSVFSSASQTGVQMYICEHTSAESDNLP